MQNWWKDIFLIGTGGALYYSLEILYRGYSHWSMFLLGGLCVFIIDKLYQIRKGILKTAEIAGHTIKMGDKRHYLLANVALVGEAIMLAMRTNYK